MKLYRVPDYLAMANPNPGTRLLQPILGVDEKAEKVGGVFALIPPGGQVPYHYHNDRESLIIPISGEAVELVEGKEITIRPNDVIYIPAREKHGTVNRSKEDFRYLEFFTGLGATDFVQVETQPK